MSKYTPNHLLAIMAYYLWFRYFRSLVQEIKYLFIFFWELLQPNLSHYFVCAMKNLISKIIINNGNQKITINIKFEMKSKRRHFNVSASFARSRRLTALYPLTLPVPLSPYNTGFSLFLDLLEGRVIHKGAWVTKLLQPFTELYGNWGNLAKFRNFRVWRECWQFTYPLTLTDFLALCLVTSF